MPQRDLLLPWCSAIDNAALALRAARDQTRRSPRAGGAVARALRVSPASSTPGPPQLSGGMRQRVSFLRSLLAGKPVLALDEPFASLDAITRAEMQGWLAHVLAAEPRTVVLVTHDVEEAVVLADRVVVMSPRPGRAVAEIEVDAAAATPADGPGGRGAARAGAARPWEWPSEARREPALATGAAARSRCSAPGSSTSTSAAPIRSSSPPPTTIASALYDRPLAAVEQLPGHRARRSCSGSSWRRSSGWRWRSRSTSPARCAAPSIRC